MELLTQKELADKFSITTQTIYNWRKEGCPYIQRGKVLRFSYEDVFKWFKETSTTKGLGK